MWTSDGRRRSVPCLAVSPNNPTGSVLSADELETLSARCGERQAALIVDEVFADYGLVAGSPDQSVDPSALLNARGPPPLALTRRLRAALRPQALL